MTETVLGFDIRTCDPAILEALWGGPLMLPGGFQSQGRGCLISVETMMMPSIFRYHFDEDDVFNSWKLASKAYGHHHNVLRLWADFDAMRMAVVRAGIGVRLPAPLVTIGITVHDVDVDALRNPYWREILAEPVTPAELSDDWQFLGFDIADDWLLSGLSHCDFESRRTAAFEARWSPCINEAGLLGDLRDAVEFKSVLDSQVQEHAPFIVYGIYKYIRDLTS